jgi:predicted nucleic acid-binding protein
MAYTVVLDANVLYPFSLRDLLLRLAEQELFVHVWSDRILEEMHRNLIRNDVSQAKADRLREVMTAAFPEAGADAEAIARIENDMPNDEKDRHVLAAAVVSGAEGIVTFNLADFEDHDLEPLSKQAVHPDDFLCTLHEMFGRAVERTLEAQAAALRNPPKTLDELLQMLDRGGTPQFVERIRQALAA